jgi:uncharacterized iron-regulated membrane protein
MAHALTDIDVRAEVGSRRRVWFALHSWVGLKLSLLMFFICLTGTLATLAYEIDWLIHPEMRVVPQDRPSASWDDWLTAAREAHPDWQLRSIDVPVDPWFAVRVSAETSAGRLRFIWIDPYTARVQGDTHWFNAHRFLRNTHRHLMLPVRIGVPIVCVLALALLVSVATSFVIYKRWWRGFLAWPRRERARRFWGDLHRLLGVWSLWFIVLIALTGVWYLVESLGGEAPALPEHPIAASTRGAVVSLDAMIADAKSLLPGLDPRSINLPTEPDDPIVVEGRAGAWLVRERANAIGFDPMDGHPRWSRRGEELSAHQRISEMADPLHFGTWGGLPTKLAWFVFGALLTALSGSGVYLYGLRVVRQHAYRKNRM